MWNEEHLIPKRITQGIVVGSGNQGVTLNELLVAVALAAGGFGLWTMLARAFNSMVTLVICLIPTIAWLGLSMKDAYGETNLVKIKRDIAFLNAKKEWLYRKQ